MEQRPAVRSPDPQVCKWNQCLFLYESRFLCWLYSLIMSMSDWLIICIHHGIFCWNYTRTQVRIPHCLSLLYSFLIQFISPSLQCVRCLIWRRYKDDQCDTFPAIRNTQCCWVLGSGNRGNLISREAVQLYTGIKQASLCSTYWQWGLESITWYL